MLMPILMLMQALMRKLTLRKELKRELKKELKKELRKMVKRKEVVLITGEIGKLKKLKIQLVLKHSKMPMTIQSTTIWLRDSLVTVKQIKLSIIKCGMIMKEIHSMEVQIKVENMIT
jgi:hypothetical protein